MPCFTQCHQNGFLNGIDAIKSFQQEIVSLSAMVAARPCKIKKGEIEVYIDFSFLLRGIASGHDLYHNRTAIPPNPSLLILAFKELNFGGILEHITRFGIWLTIMICPSNFITMIRNYFKTAFRNLLKNKGFTILNVLGLAVGLATCLLIVLYVTDEWRYDRFHKNAERIYRVTVAVKLNDHEGVYATTEAPLQKALQENFPEIELTTRIIDDAGLALAPEKFYIKKENSNILERKIAFSESSLFKVFTLPMIAGNPANALDAPNTAVITESTARKYFNKVDVVGEMLTINDSSFYKITGVIKDIPAQSHFHYDFFLSFSSRPESKWTGWGYSGIHNYVLVKPGANIKSIEARIRETEIKNSFDPSAWTAGSNYLQSKLTPLTDIHLRDADTQYPLEKGGHIQYVYIFSLIAVFILLIACVNFMNLSTAKSANRAKEVGVRKVLGSSRQYLVAQFLSESILTTLIAAIIAVVVAWSLLPLYNVITDKQLFITKEILYWLLPSLLVIVLVVGLLAGSYPAFYISAFQPGQVLKGKIAGGFKRSMLRNFLVVFQFSISIFLMIGTLVIYHQLKYIHNKDLGFDRDEVLVIKNTNLLGSQAAVLKDKLKQMPGVMNVTLSSFQPTGEEKYKTGLFPNREINIKEDILSEFWSVDEDYLGTMGLNLVQGRNFSKQIASDSAGLIVNEAFVRKLNQKEPLSKDIFRNSFGLEQFHIIGVVKDFNFASLRNNIGPLALTYKKDIGAVNVKLRTANLSALMAQIEQQWKELLPNQAFSYTFMDQDFDAAYRSEQRMGTMFVAFSTLAILIACLGLFGLAAYAAEQRIKEIGIRKVLGATVSSLVSTLSMDFIKLVFISILVASPLAWVVMNKWLEGFAYRVQFNWYLLLAAGFAAMFIAFVTICFQFVRAALTNPVENLRTE